MGDNGNGEDKNESGTKNGERNHDNDNNKKSTTSTEEKSLFWTFLRFVFGGLFGMHHFYLNRDFQAVIWTATFGGFGIGLLYDFFFLTRYVEIANEMAASKKLFNFKRGLGTFLFRIIGQVWFGAIVRNTVLNAVPLDEEVGIPFAKLLGGVLGALACAYCVIQLGNQSYFSGTSYVAIGMALLAEAIIYASNCIGSNDDQIELTSCNGDYSFAWRVALVTTVSFYIDRYFKLSNKYFNVKTDIYTPPKPYCQRCCSYTWLVVLYGVLLGSLILFNVSTIDDNNEKTTLYRELKKIFHSEEWATFMNQCEDVFKYCNEHRDECMEKLVNFFEPESSKMERSLFVLGLDTSATASQVKANHRKLLAKYHPDRCVENDCEANFMAVEDAFQFIIARMGDRN
eukprot:m.5659 g.5659  ORF g.5659 m.5659 type:complete len:399 (-) comp2446_c0_seq1:25-1221(-)